MTLCHAKTLKKKKVMGKGIWDWPCGLDWEQEMWNCEHKHKEKERTEYNPFLNKQLSSNTNWTQPQIFGWQINFTTYLFSLALIECIFFFFCFPILVVALDLPMYFQWPFLDRESFLNSPTQPLFSLTPKKGGKIIDTCEFLASPYSQLSRYLVRKEK